jgi:hypothetical protein
MKEIYMKNKKLKLKIIENYGSQVKFAYENGENEALVSKVIHGWRELDPERQIVWAEALHSTPAELFGREQPDGS